MQSEHAYTCEVPHAEHVATVTLVESERGTGDWSVIGIQVVATNGTTLSADRLRNLAWANVLESARAQAREVHNGASVVLSRPSDPPPSFRADRRGRAARSDRDYAELARAYLAFPPDRRRKAAATWSERFGRQPGRWRADIAKAKRFIEGGWLTGEGMVLVYGADIFEHLVGENELGAAEAAVDLLAGDGLGTPQRAWLDVQIERRARQTGLKPAEVRSELLRQARTKIDSYYSSESG
ncbi:hypothetical protein [Aeromicrobium sp. JJY06]|uniref:hypothetical protein n=1 Tax=Aeromicrobium sp. JJY06 TaxID=3373478 RepID=UPI00376EFBBC